ncbi:MAG: helix-turn-helix transcriptional regulator [Anaerolineales bacterium]
MPGYRRGRSRPCPKRQRRGMRLLLRPSLLLLLAESESHGYELYDQLVTFGFETERLDSSIVYRDLREMEEQGYIESYWDEDSKGPKRRMYKIREEGKIRLAEWIDVLDNIQGQMKQLIKRYKTS